MTKYFNIKTFCDKVGVSEDTARRWDRVGKLVPARTDGGHRRYTDKDVATALHLQVAEPAKRCVVYCRVSGRSQKDDLQNQIDYLSDFANGRGYIFDVVSEIGGGMNMNRPKFMSLVTGMIDGSIGTIIVAHKDRLMRFGSDLFKNIADTYGCDIIITNMDKLSPESEMVEDLMSIVHTYSCRLYGLRRYKKSSDLLGDDSHA